MALCFSSSSFCVPFVVSICGFSVLIAPSVFSNAYLPLSTIFLLKFETVPKVWYFLFLCYP